MKQDVVVVGYSETPITLRSGRSAYDLAGEALSELLQSTGLAKDDIDGFCATAALSEGDNPFHAVQLAELLGLQVEWLQLSSLGGCSMLAGLAAAVSAIRDRRCDVAVVIGADAPSTAFNARPAAHRAEFQAPLGFVQPPGAFGLLLSAYEARHGSPASALGKIATTQRRHALMNERACKQLQTPLELEGYLTSKLIADPLRMLDSVMFCDGANAVMLMSEATATTRGFRKMARVASYAEVSNYRANDPAASVTETGFLVAGPRALQHAGLSAQNIRMLQAYDDFTIAVLIQLEQIGFCSPGSGARFIEETDLSWTGALPLNTGGGQISAGQPGLASGGLNLVEAVRQLFREAGERQVPDSSNAMVTGIGGVGYARNWITSSALVLET